MEMCIDNPREGFSNIFDTHPSVDARAAALVKFAGGHDPGPLALPAPAQQSQESEEESAQAQPQEAQQQEGQQQEPWGSAEGEKPFLPPRPPLELGSSGEAEPGPWGPHRK